MKRSVKNDRVLRAITIGLATMIAATSAPITVLAEDGMPDFSSSDSAPADPTPAESAPSAPIESAPAE
ncbi:MAG: hypothetical protein K6E49_05580 [Lachnospiraceae bacterium]|nr:hypothetical protein [Lachnospiraceae bacterium]